MNVRKIYVPSESDDESKLIPKGLKLELEPSISNHDQ